MSNFRFLRLGTTVLLTASLIAPAVALTSLGGMKLAAPLINMRVSQDGRTTVALLQPSGGMSTKLQVIDTTDPQHPKAAGALDLPSSGDMALSSGGQRALVHLSPPRQEFNRETVHEVIAVDLSDRRTPRVLWRDQVSASKVVLSSQADAFAYSRLVAGKDSEWEVVVVSTANRRQRAVFPDKGGPLAQVVLSPHGKYLAQVSFGNLTIWNLKATTPVPFEQEGSFVERFVYNCEPFVLDSGHVVIADSRVPRLNVYEATTGVPRVAKLNVEETSCNALNPNSGDRVFALRDSIGRVSMLDLHKPNAPKGGSLWHLPAGTTAVAIAGGVLFAATDRSSELRLFQLDSPGVPAVDWRALSDAHRSAMDALNLKRVAGRTSFPWDTVNALEAAGAGQALDAPVEGISASRAAAILNDYGFLALQTGRPRPTVESALRRAIAIDPGRALAHLNLADFLRTDLARYAATGGNVAGRIREITAHYRAYVASGAKPSAGANSFLRGDPGAGAKSDCDAIAMWTNAGRLKELVSDVATNLPWKGMSIDLVFATQGTAHVPVIEAFDATTDRVLDEEEKAELATVSENLWGDSQLGLITLHGRHHIIHYLDWNHPVKTMPLNGGEECSFEVAARESIGTRATEPQLCRALQAGSIDSTIEFGSEAPLSGDEVQKVWPETVIGGISNLAFGNDGVLLNVAEFRMDSSAGAGCGETFYDLLDAGGTEFLRGPQRDQLMKLQAAADGEYRYPVSCGNQPRFFSHGNLIYFESKPATWPPKSDREQYHLVTTVRNDRVVDVCDFRFQPYVSVRRR